MSSRPVYRMCVQVAPSAEYLRGHGRVAVDVTALRRLCWQHLPVLGLVILACAPVCAVVVAVCQLLIKAVIIVMCIAKQFKYPDSEQRKPPVPRPNDRPVMGLRTTKDYVTQNAVENIKSIARRPDKTYVDTRRGDKHSLVPSGLEPVYLHKKVER